MDISAMSIQQLRYIAAVAEHDSFGDAADALFVSQSALSQGLARLEALAGMPLFEADGRRRRLTEAGRRVARTARRVISDTERLDVDLEARRAGRAGTLRVGMIDAVALYLFSDGIASFQRTFPEVDLQITVEGTDACLERLGRFEDDLALVIGPVDGFDSIEITDEAMALFGPSEAPGADSVWAMYPTGSNTRALVDAGLRVLGHEPRVTTESGNPDVLHTIAVLSQAWTVLPQRFADSTPLVQGPQVAMRSIVAVRRTGGARSRIADQFLATLI